LKETAAFLRRNMRINDVAVRWGGDEFLLIFNSVTNAELTIIMERARKNLENFDVMLPCGTVLRPRMSIGCVWGYPDKNSEWKDIVSSADKLLYKVKKNRKETEEDRMGYAIETAKKWNSKPDAKPNTGTAAPRPKKDESAGESAETRA